jgi:anion-transporting  ArsA/GET3 family ATPase
MRRAVKPAIVCSTLAMKELLRKGSIIILLGTGGVGKTTVAAALGIAAAKAGLNTAVITVDPARRLRDALGLDSLAGNPTPLSAEQLRAAGLAPDLRLSAMMLDVKGAWDAMAEQFAKDPATRRRILENPFYKSLSTEFAGSEAYAALEKLYDLHQNGDFDIEIVDTPPAAHAFDFLQAPARLIRLLDSRTARWLFTPSLSAGRLAMKFASQAARFVVRELERFAGKGVLSTISDFFAAASETLDATVDRLRKTEALLRSPSAHFVLVTTAEEDRLRGAQELIDEMRSERLGLGAIVLNRFLDEETWSEVMHDPTSPPRHLEGISALRASMKADISSDRGIKSVVDFLEEYRVRVLADIARVDRYARELSGDVKLAVSPEIEVGISDLGALARIADFLTTPVGAFAAHARDAKAQSRAPGRRKAPRRRARR